MADILDDESGKVVKEHNLDHVPLGTTYQLFVSGSFASGFGTLFALIACVTDDWTTFSSTLTTDDITTSYSGYASLYRCSRTFKFSVFLPETDDGIAEQQEIYSQTNSAYIRCGGDSDLDCPFMLISQLSIVVAILCGALSLHFLWKVLSRRWDGLVYTAKLAVCVNFVQMFFVLLTLIMFTAVNNGKFDGNSTGHPCGDFVLESTAILNLPGVPDNGDNAIQSDITGLDGVDAELGESMNFAIVSIVFLILSSVLIWNAVVGYQLFTYQERRMLAGTQREDRQHQPRRHAL